MSLPKIGLVALTAVALTGLAACGGDDNKKTETEKKPTTQTTTATTPAAGSGKTDSKTMGSTATKSIGNKTKTPIGNDKSADGKKTTDGAKKTTDGAKKPAAGAAGTYVTQADYTKNGAAKDGKTVLFFHAKWCPSCKALDSSLTKSVPAGLQVVKVDYDAAKDLKKKYGVTTQHTLVQVDASGKQLKKWSGAKDGAAIAAKLG